MATILGTPKVQYFKTGTVDYLVNGRLYSYEANSLTPKATYPTIADALAGTNANSNPVVLDSRGEADIVLQGNTKLILKDENDNVIWTADNLEQASTDILDENGNELLRFVTTASAVNEWTITNAATTGKPKFQATGGDTNVTGQILSKGSGNLELDGGTTGDLELNSTSTGNINLRRATYVRAGGFTVVSGGATITAGGVTITAGGLTAVAGGVTITAGGLTVNGGGITTTSGATSLLATAAFNLIPAGVVNWYAGSSAPTGWLECDGSAISRSTYATLFGIIGTTYGSGDGSTTFNLPAQARRVLVGKGGSGTATLANTIGSTGGSETHTLTVSEMPAHTHTVLASAVATQSGSNQTVLEGSSTQTSSSTGGGTAHNNMQPSLVMMMIIRAY